MSRDRDVDQQILEQLEVIRGDIKVLIAKVARIEGKAAATGAIISLVVSAMIGGMGLFLQRS